ncbi:hypothetical protein VTO42DRAFT_4262 [Malbranchea cinnamomea]
MTNRLRQGPSSSLNLQPGAAYIYALAPCGDDALAVISSDNSLRCFSRSTLQLLSGGVKTSIHVGQRQESGATGLCQVSVAGGSPAVATSGRDGTVKIWDLRASGNDPVSTFFTENYPPLTALSFNAQTNTVVAGTELVSYQASVAFWDIRSPGPPRLQYVDSHNDDVTELQFHPTRPAILLSGSTDGLVNIYDTTVTDEDDAGLQVIKHSSIHRAGFLDDQTIFALSHDEIFSIHPLTNPDDDATESAAPVHFGDVRPSLECEYVVQILSSPSGAYIAAGSTSRQTLDLVPIVQTPPFKFSFDRSRMWRLPGAHGEEVVRSVFLDEQSQTLFSCGEDGLVRVWREDEQQGVSPDYVKPKENAQHGLPIRHHKQHKSHPQSKPERETSKKHKEKKQKKGFNPY